MKSVSVIICTRDRAESLRTTLASLTAITVPCETAVELLIVDNGSSDHTAEVVRHARLPQFALRYLHEPQSGQCFARNAGLRAAKGTVILFTDDDVRVPPRWIHGMTSPIFAGVADAVAGGVVFPESVEASLSFLTSESAITRAWFAATEGLDRSAPHRFVGANMAFGRHVLERVPAFDTALGPGALGFGDETLFSWRLLREGFRLAGAFDIAVEHHFDVSRLTSKALLELAQRMGRSEGYAAWHCHGRNALLGKLVLPYLRLKFLCRKLTSRGSTRAGGYPSNWEIWYSRWIAFYEQLLSESRSPRKYTDKGMVAST